MEILYLSFVDWILAISGVVGLFYLYATWNNDYFIKRNISYAKPMFLFGSLGRPLFKTASYFTTITEIYNLFPDEKYTGLFELRRPVLMLKDPDLIKQIMIRDFDYFVNHRFEIDENVDPLFGKNIFTLKGQKWREMRVTLSPAFTGSKMRAMYSMINDCAYQVVNYINKEAKNGSSLVELKDLSTRFASDIIATSAFGVMTNSFTDRNNEFYEIGKKLTKPGMVQNFKFAGLTAFPALMRHLKLTMFDDNSSNFFRNLIRETITMRQRDKIYRPDMIHLLMQARKGLLQHDAHGSDAEGYAVVPEHLHMDINIPEREDLIEDDITSQALLFYVAGFQQASILICFAAYELTVNGDVQQKLQAEIDEAKEQHKTITYDIIHSLKYLDMVVSETLRLWPSNPVTDRCCVKPYTLRDGDTEIKFNPGEAILIPICALHRDPEHFPDPDKFDPERFSPENVRNIKSGTYLPFGYGPRNCIASRFAIMETKAILYHLVANFELRVSSKTQIPLKLDKSSFVFAAEKGFWIDFKPRVI